MYDELADTQKVVEHILQKQVVIEKIEKDKKNIRKEKKNRKIKKAKKDSSSSSSSSSSEDESKITKKTIKKETSIMHGETTNIAINHYYEQNESSTALINNNETLTKKQTKKLEKQKTKKQKKTLKDYNKQAYSVCIAGAIFSFLIALFGIILAFKAGTSFSMYFIAFGIISMLIFCFGIWAIYKYIKFVNEHGVETADQSDEREILNLFIYLIIILLFAFFILAIGSLAYQKEVRSYIKSYSRNETEWMKIFGTFTYTDLHNYLKTTLVCLGIFSIIMILLIMSIIIFSFKILDPYRFIQTLVQFFCLIFFIFGALILYIAIYLNRYKDIVSNESGTIPGWVPVVLFGFSIISIIIAIGGYWSIQKESSIYIGIFCIVTSIFTLIILCGSIYAILYSGKFEEVFSNNCKSIMNIVSEDFLKKYAGCSRKYIEEPQTFIPMDCPKDRILIAWDIKLKKMAEMKGFSIQQLNNEENYIYDISDDSINNKVIPVKNSTTSSNSTTSIVDDHFGCYDSICCTKVYNSLASKANYMKIISIFLLITGLICAIGSYKVYYDLANDLQQAGEARKKNYLGNAVVILLFIAVLIVIILAIVNLPKKPRIDPADDVEENASQNNTINFNLIIKSDLNKTTLEEIDIIKREIKNNTKINEKKDCGDKCPVVRYNFELSSKDGIFKRSQTADFTNIIMKIEEKQGDNYVVKFESGPKTLQNFNEYFQFVHNCPMLPSHINIKVNGEVFAPSTSFIQKKIRTISKKNSKSMDPDPQNSLNITRNDSSINTVINTAQTIDYSKLIIGDKFTVLNYNIDYSFVTKEFQVIQGKVIKRLDAQSTTAIQGAQITIKSLDFGQCSSIQITTDQNGNFKSPPIYFFNEGMKTKVSIEITLRDFNTYKNTIITGGIGAPKIIDLGIIELWSSALLELTNISSNVINSIDNKFLAGVTVKAYEGYVTFDNEVSIDSSQSSGFLTGNTNGQNASADQSGSKSYYKMTMTNVDGFYEFKDLPTNFYTFVFEKPGFYREIISNLLYFF